MNIKNKLMLFCMGVLVLALLSIGVRFAARQVLVKKLNMDNIVTQTIFFDNHELSKNIKKNDPLNDVDEIKIDWEELYPFDEPTKKSKPAVESKTKNADEEKKGVKQKVTDWANDNFLLYRYWVDCGMKFRRATGMVTDRQVQKLNDGYYIFAFNRINMTERADSVAEFARFAKENGAGFCYVNVLAKTNKFADSEVRGIDYANDNADELLEKLQERGVDTLDLREYAKGFSPSKYHALFFRTDHHWLPTTGMWAAGILADKLNTMGIAADKKYMDAAYYEEKIYPKAFLGSQGGRLKLSDEFYDDISLYYPKFPNKFHIEVPSYNVNKTGDFSVVYDKKLLADAEKIGRLTYFVYRYRLNPITKIDNLNLNSDDRVLIIGDSFQETMGVFLATGVAHITFLDIRIFNGSVRKFIEELKPTAIIVAYLPEYTKNLNWNSHTDIFDFR